MQRLALVMVCCSILGYGLLVSACSHGADPLTENGSPAPGSNSNSNGSSQIATAKATPSLLPPAGPVDPAFKPCNPYYPLTPGSHMLYTIKRPSGQVGSVVVDVSAANEKGKKVFTEVAKRLSVRGVGSGLETTTRKYVCDGENIQVVYNLIEATNPQGVSGKFDGRFPSPSLVMMAPSSLTPGASWSYTMEADIKLPEKPDPKQAKREANQNKKVEPKYTSKHDTIQLSFEVKGKEDVTVPAGTFHAIRIAVKVKDKDSDEYYAPGVGLVRRSLPDGTVWELSEYNGLTPRAE